MKNYLKVTCTIPSYNYWHPPVCQNYKSDSGCKIFDKCLFRHTEPDRQPTKKSGGKGSVALLEKSEQLVNVSQQTEPPKKSILRKSGKSLGSNRTVRFSKGTLHPAKNRERVHRKELFRSVSRKSAIRGRQNSRIGHFRKPCNKNDAPAEKHGIWRKMSVSSHKGQGHVLLPNRSLGNAGTLFEEI